MIASQLSPPCLSESSCPLYSLSACAPVYTTPAHLLPLGPRDVLMASATARAAVMLPERTAVGFSLSRKAFCRGASPWAMSSEVGLVLTQKVDGRNHAMNKFQTSRRETREASGKLEVWCLRQQQSHDAKYYSLPFRIIFNISSPFGAVVKFLYPSFVMRIQSSILTPPTCIYRFNTSRSIYFRCSGWSR